jgi:hypothetical protein
LQIFARRFDSAGNALSGEIAISDPAIQSQVQPTVAIEASGDALVAWKGQLTQAPFTHAILARRVSVNNGVGTPFQISGALPPLPLPQTSWNLGSPDVAGNGSGNYVVAFQTFGNSDIFVHRIVGGAPTGFDVPVNTFTAGIQQNATVAMNASGAFVVCYESTGQTSQSNGASDIYCRRFNDSGVALDAQEFRATAGIGQSSTTSHTQPDVAMDNAGNFVVTWVGGIARIFAARFMASSIVAATSFQVDTTPGDNEYNPSIAMDARGRFVISWQEGTVGIPVSGDGDAQGIFARRFIASGVPSGARFQVNASIVGNQQKPSVAMNRRGEFGIAWQSDWQNPHQPNAAYQNIFAALYDGPQPPVGLSLNTSAADCSAAIGGLPLQVSFDDLPANTRLSGQTVNGVRFVSLGNTLPVVAALDTRTPGDPSRRLLATSGTNLLSPGGISLPLTGPASEDSLEFNFANPVSAFRFDLSLQSLDDSTFTDLVLFDASNRFIAELPIPGVPGNVAGSPPGTLPVCVVYNQPTIAKVQLLEFDSDGVNPDSNIGIDSLASSVTGHSLNFTASSASRTEAQTATIHLTLTPASTSAVTVPFTLSGTASLGSDYTFTPNTSTVTFNPGDTQKDIVISGIDDKLDEATETVNITLGTPAGADLGNATAYTLSLTDNDPSPTVAFAASNETVTEGDAKTIKVILSKASGQSITVPFTVGGTATAGADYTRPSLRSLTFNPGIISQSIRLSTIDDSTRESSETVVLTLSRSPTATPASPSVNTLTINDND